MDYSYYRFCGQQGIEIYHSLLKVSLNKDHLVNYHNVTYSLTFIYTVKTNHKNLRVMVHCNPSLVRQRQGDLWGSLFS